MGMGRLHPWASIGCRRHAWDGKEKERFTEKNSTRDKYARHTSAFFACACCPMVLLCFPDYCVCALPANLEIAPASAGCELMGHALDKNRSRCWAVDASFGSKRNLFGELVY